MSMLGTKQPKYTDGRTKQAFKDETDINKLLQRAEKTGTISHLNKYEARYGDFTGFDFTEAQIKLAQGAEIFADLPAEVRSEFQGRPAEFFDYVNDPANKDRLATLLPDLAAPGKQLVDVRATIPADEDTAATLAEKSTTEAKAEEKAKEPEKGSEARTPAEKAGSSAPT